MMHHKHHSPAMRLLAKVAWLLSALAALAVGLAALGMSMGKNWNFWESEFLVNNMAWLIQPLQYAVGLAGLISLIGWFMCMGCDEKHK